MRYEVTEHHFDLRGLPAGKVRRWKVSRGTTTSQRRTVEGLAAIRRSGTIPDTLSEWTVGSHRVHGQSLTEMLERQGVAL